MLTLPLTRGPLVLVLCVLALAGCQAHSFYELVPTPRIYTRGIVTDPFDHVPEARRTPSVEVIYVTDRAPGKIGDRGQEYGYERSRSSAFGTLRVAMGPTTWDDLVAESRREKRSSGMKLSASDIAELGRFPETPEPMQAAGEDRWELRPDVAARRAEVEQKFRELVRRRLAESEDKDIYLFVHGYNSEFEWPAFVIAQLWHFMGRGGVPMAYSWPAARPGLLRGYQYDRESGEFTVTHLKRLLLLLGSIEEVGKVHILAHSRGTDVTTSALRELRFELGGPLKTRETLKMGTLVLAAADLDAEVASQRVTAPGVPLVPTLFVLYVSEGDNALGTSTWLFGSARRVGMLRPADLRKEATQFLLRNSGFEVIDARVKTPSVFSHSYFFAHPGALSDLILVMRDEKPAGAEHGRPLRRDPSGFWVLDEQYPASSTP